MNKVIAVLPQCCLWVWFHLTALNLRHFHNEAVFTIQFGHTRWQALTYIANLPKIHDHQSAIHHHLHTWLALATFPTIQPIVDISMESTYRRSVYIKPTRGYGVIGDPKEGSLWGLLCLMFEAGVLPDDDPGVCAPCEPEYRWKGDCGEGLKSLRDWLGYELGVYAPAPGEACTLLLLIGVEGAGGGDTFSDGGMSRSLQQHSATVPSTSAKHARTSDIVGGNFHDVYVGGPNVTFTSTIWPV